MALALVRNIPNTSDDNEQPDWLNYWTEQKGLEHERCANLLCDTRAEHGGHVELTKYPRGPLNRYIVPLCRSCNHTTNMDPHLIFADVLLDISQAAMNRRAALLIEQWRRGRVPTFYDFCKARGLV